MQTDGKKDRKAENQKTERLKGRKDRKTEEEKGRKKARILDRLKSLKDEEQKDRRIEG